MKEFKNKKGQPIGYYKDTDKIFRKRVKLSKHLFRMRDSWGIDKAVFDEIGELGCEEIRILEEEHSKIYSISYRDFWGYSTLDKYGDEGNQIFCPRERFTVSEYEERGN